jgi:undecaprenyl-diphosphatase
MIDTFEAIILGLVQGFTEFLPVSSSGHLVIFSHLFNSDASGGASDILFDCILHVATLLPILFYYRADIIKLLDYKTYKGASGLGQRDLFYSIVIATIVTGSLAMVFKDYLEEMFQRPVLVGFSLLFTGCILISTRWTAKRSDGSALIGWQRAILIGLGQFIAVTPGISRSGTTIALALLLGLPRENAVRFSFLISIPAILGATLLQARKISTSTSSVALIVGFLAAMLAGWFALIFLVRIVKRGGLHLFAYYCIPVGLITILYFLLTT